MQFNIYRITNKNHQWLRQIQGNGCTCSTHIPWVTRVSLSLFDWSIHHGLKIIIFHNSHLFVLSRFYPIFHGNYPYSYFYRVHILLLQFLSTLLKTLWFPTILYRNFWSLPAIIKKRSLPCYANTVQKKWIITSNVILREAGAHSSAIRLSRDSGSAVGGTRISKPACASDGCTFMTKPWYTKKGETCKF